MEMHRTQLVLMQLLCIVMHQIVESQLLRVESFQEPSGDSAPNTFIGTGRQIASSLLDATTPALMYGVVSSAHVIAVCQQIVYSGRLSVNVDVITSLESSTSQSLTLQITATGGCTEANDASGTEAVMVDDSGRRSALICPSTNASSTGCAIYLTGDDVSRLYNQGNRRRLLARRTLLHKYAGEAKKGAISGAITGILSVAACATFTGPLARFCAANMLGASAVLGAAAGCATSCFPGDATVRMANGRWKRMTALSLGDKVAVRKRDGGLAYQEVYAFGHRDAFGTGKFLRLTMKPIDANMSDAAVETRSLELTLLHSCTSHQALQKISCTNEHKRFARETKCGLTEHLPSDSSSLHIVTSISEVAKQGLYNPFTLGGTNVVNGLEASTHSDWFLDSTFELFNLVHWLPAA